MGIVWVNPWLFDFAIPTSSARQEGRILKAQEVSIWGSVLCGASNILLVSGDGCCPPAIHTLLQNLGLGLGCWGLQSVTLAITLKPK